MIRKKHAGIHQIKYGETAVSFALSYSKRKTLTIRVHPDQTVAVDAPTGTPLPYIRDIVQKKAGWIIRKLQDIQTRAHPTALSRQYVSGEVYHYLGQEICLNLEVGKSSRAILTGDILTITTPTPHDAERVEALLRGWYRRQAERVFAERMAACQPKAMALGIPAPQEFTLRQMKSRWGSCSGKGRVTLNVRLIQADIDLIDYVILHELCHLKELNHSTRFYDLMTRILPDWKAKRFALNRSRMTW
jgi:hypothetical protein